MMGSIVKKIFARKRLYENIKKINNISINEIHNISEESYATLMTCLEVLANGGLLRKTGGDSKIETQIKEDSLFVRISGIDKEKNEYLFNFLIEYDEGLEDDVVQIINIDIMDFHYQSNDDGFKLGLDENDLRDFNKNKNLDFYDIISQYVDFNLEDEVRKEYS